MANIDINKTFREYCERVGLDIATAPTAQVIETRRAFFAGVGQLLVWFRTEMSDDEDVAVVEMQKAWDDVEAFWKRQVAGQYGSEIVSNRPKG